MQMLLGRKQVQYIMKRGEVRTVGNWRVQVQCLVLGDASLLDYGPAIARASTVFQKKPESWIFMYNLKS